MDIRGPTNKQPRSVSTPDCNELQLPSRSITFQIRSPFSSNPDDLAEANRKITELNRKLDSALSSLDSIKEFRRRDFKHFLKCTEPSTENQKDIDSVPEDKERFDAVMKKNKIIEEKLGFSETGSPSAKENTENPNERFRRIFERDEAIQKTVEEHLERLEKQDLAFIGPISSGIKDLICWVESCFISSGIKDLICWVGSFFIKR